MSKSTEALIGVLGIILVAAFAWWLIATAPQVPTDSGFTVATTTGATRIAAHSNVSVLAIANNLSGGSAFAGWLSSTGVASEITGKGPYTVFVPTNSAIARLPSGTFLGLSAADRQSFVEYYVIKGKALDADALVAGQERALSGDYLNISYGNQKIPMVNSSIITGEYHGSNGVVYVIDTALIPPHSTLPQ